jgi:DNA helicase IV
MNWLVDFDRLRSEEGSNQKEIVLRAKEIIESGKDNQSIVIKGPAGTGKTLVLAHIALQVPDKNGFFFVYTHSLRKFLSSAFKDANQGLTSGLSINNFHKYLFDLYKNTFHESPPPITSFDEKTDLMMDKISSRIRNKIFDYVLIDEGQDFSPKTISFLRSISKVMVFVGDGNQAIYVKHDINLTNLTQLLGQPESHNLKLSMRISPSLIKLLYPYISRIEEYKKGLKFLNKKNENGEVRDSKPLWFRDVDYDSFIKYFAENLVMDYIRSGKNIVIACYHNEDVKKVSEKLRELLQPEFIVLVTKDREDEIDFSESKIYLITMHSSKGLEFDNLLYLHINSAPIDDKDGLYDNLAYTVYTRPKEDLIIYSPDKNIPLKSMMNLDHITIVETLDLDSADEDIDEIKIF